MALKTVVAFVKEVQKGATISYGRTFTADRKMKIATVPIGYADGFIRQNAKDGYMTVNGKKSVNCVCKLTVLCSKRSYSVKRTVYNAVSVNSK